MNATPINPLEQQLHHAQSVTRRLRAKVAASKRSSDPLIKTMRKVYAASATGRVAKLMDEERFWRRRATIAANKLERVQLEIRLAAIELAEQQDKKGLTL